MPNSIPSRLSPKRRIQLVVISLLGLLVPSACTPPTTCYAIGPATDTPVPLVTCYTVVPTPSPFTSPISPISPLPTPTPTPQARHQLLDRLRAEGRLPEDVARQL